MFAENSVGLRFLQSVSDTKPILTREKIFADGGKSGPNFNLIFRRVELALGWGVRRFQKYYFTCFSTHHLVDRKHPIFTGVHSNQDQILLVKIRKYIYTFMLIEGPD